jgi:hypothetical protein
VSSGPLTGSTRFTLTVTNAAGASVTAQVTVGITGVITFTTEGAGFAPVIVVTGSPQILWTFASGTGNATTSSSARPSVSWGTTARRQTTLVVTPWSALQRINIGYDGGDGGSTAIETVPDQHVSAVSGLSVVAPTLQQWCSSYNLLTALDFGNFTHLDTIEAFHSYSLASVNLANTPALARACFEDNNLSALDLTGSPNLQDLRGALNAFPTITFGAVPFPQQWHVCARDNSQIADPTLFSDSSLWPAISELWIWNTNQSGALRVASSSPTRYVSVLAYQNHYTTADLSGSMLNKSSWAQVDLSQNQLTAIVIDGCVQLTQLNLAGNQLPVGVVDYVLGTLDQLGRSSNDASAPKVDLSGGTNAPPSAASAAALASLRAKGWNVVTN